MPPSDNAPNACRDEERGRSVVDSPSPYSRRPRHTGGRYKLAHGDNVQNNDDVAIAPSLAREKQRVRLVPRRHQASHHHNYDERQDSRQGFGDGPCIPHPGRLYDGDDTVITVAMWRFRPGPSVGARLASSAPRPVPLAPVPRATSSGARSTAPPAGAARPGGTGSPQGRPTRRRDLVSWGWSGLVHNFTCQRNALNRTRPDLLAMRDVPPLSKEQL